MTIVQWIIDSGQELQSIFTSNIRTRNKGDFSDFDRGVSVGVRQAGLSETADPLGF